MKLVEANVADEVAVVDTVAKTVANSVIVNMVSFMSSRDPIMIPKPDSALKILGRMKKPRQKMLFLYALLQSCWRLLKQAQ